MSIIKTLELRINSVDDARSVAQNCMSIESFAKTNGLTEINLLYDPSVEKEFFPLVAGLFSLKCFYSKVRPNADSIFYPVPHINGFNPKITQPPNAVNLGVVKSETIFIAPPAEPAGIDPSTSWLKPSKSVIPRD